jgi:hypothetical protein
MEPSVKILSNRFLTFVGSSQKKSAYASQVTNQWQSGNSLANVWRQKTGNWLFRFGIAFEELRQAFFALKATPFRTGFSRNHFVT